MPKTSDKKVTEATEEEVIEIFSKIWQKGTVAEYQKLFQDL